MRSQAYEKFIERIENFGNSISFYLLLTIIAFGIWILTPFAPDWRPDGETFGLIALAFAALTMLHGILWLIITRESLKLKKGFKAALASVIRLIRPLHMMTGMLALGVVLVHTYAFMRTGYAWDIKSYSGLVTLVVLGILAIDGIGLMASPFLNRNIHRWMAAGFVIVLGVHLWMVL